MRLWLPLALCAGACTAVDRDLLAPGASPCDLGADRGTWTSITPPSVVYDGTRAGLTTLVMDPYDTSVLYGPTDRQGVWRTGDCGATWTRTNTGINGPVIQDAILLELQLDRVARDTLYTAPRFTGNGLWWSTNAGVHWEEILPASFASAVSPVGYADIARIAVDPAAPHHLVASSMQPWIGTGEDAGIYEGTYDPATSTWQWTAHAPASGMGTAQWITMIDASTWIIASPFVPAGEGTWRTTDGGRTFARVDVGEAAQAWQLYRGADGTLYHTAAGGLWRSTDGGASWTDVFVGLGIGGTQAITGDGTSLIVGLDTPEGEARERLYTAPEVPGDRGWVPLGDAPIEFAPRGFLRDAGRDVIYTFSDLRGVYRMRLP